MNAKRSEGAATRWKRARDGGGGMRRRLAKNARREPTANHKTRGGSDASSRSECCIITRKCIFIFAWSVGQENKC